MPGGTVIPKTIPWQDEDYRGWYCDGGTLLWSSGVPHEFSEEVEEALYYCTPDDMIPWDKEPPRYDWGDTYDIDADERQEEALLEREIKLTWRHHD